MAATTRSTCPDTRFAARAQIDATQKRTVTTHPVAACKVHTEVAPSGTTKRRQTWFDATLPRWDDRYEDYGLIPCPKSATDPSPAPGIVFLSSPSQRACDGDPRVHYSLTRANDDGWGRARRDGALMTPTEQPETPSLIDKLSWG